MEYEKLNREPDTIPELVLNYQFWKGPESATKVHDYSGNGNTGIVGGGAEYTYPALSLNGIDQYITVADNATLNFGTSDFSISFWIKLANTTNDRIILSKFSTVGYYIQFTAEPTKIELTFSDGSFPPARISTADLGINDNIWYSIVFSSDRNGIGICYVNGIPRIASITMTESLDSIDNISDIVFGDNIGGGISSLDDIRIYKGKALTQEEVSSIYNLQRHRYSV